MKKLIAYISLFYALIIINYINFDFLYKESFINTVEDLKLKIKYYPIYYDAHYLDYVPNIHFRESTDTSTNIFNKHGYRGEYVPIEKNNQKLRILFLGGSTTNNNGGTTIYSSYPEIVRNILSKKYDIDSVEIINAGIDGANSFVILSHYLYKYKYYKPDIIVIHTGFNDCAWYSDSIYYTDYTHLSYSFSSAVDKISPLKRFISELFLEYRATAWLYIKYLELSKKYSGSEVIKKSAKERENIPVWSSMPTETALYQTKYNAFYNNIKTLISIAKLENSQLVLMQIPVIDNYNGDYNDCIQSHYSFLEKISSETNTPIIQTQDLNIPNKCFTDIVHVDSVGNYLKADKVAERIFQIKNAYLK